MEEAYDAPTRAQADKAGKGLDRLIEKKASNVKKLQSYKCWWWWRRTQWQKWCRPDSSTQVSSAEVSNARSVRASGYNKNLLDVVTAECATAVIEAAEIRRQTVGFKTVGRLLKRWSLVEIRLFIPSSLI